MADTAPPSKDPYEPILMFRDFFSGDSEIIGRPDAPCLLPPSIKEEGASEDSDSKTGWGLLVMSSSLT